MARTFSATEVSVAVGAAVIVGLGIGFVAGQNSVVIPGPKTEIILRDKSDGCRPDNPARLGAGHRDQVVWNIKNKCSSAYSVKVDKFKPVNSNGSFGNPVVIVDPAAPETSAPIQPGDSFLLPAQVRDDADYRHFKYEIQLKGTAEGSKYD